MGQNRDNEQIESIESFIAQGRIDEVLGVIKSGKEATVYLCTGGPLISLELVAAKVYRSRNVRSFRDDAVYRHGRSTGSSKTDRGLKLKTRTGQNLRFSQWVVAEHETLRVLHRAGGDVPEPVAHNDDTILMEYIGDGDDPAPLLSQAHLEPAEARAIFERLLWNIERMLACDRVHGDLSPYNILYRGQRRVTVIDFPQAVDARTNGNALDLLERDIERICAWAGRHGIEADSVRIARQLWGRFLRSEL